MKKSLVDHQLASPTACRFGPCEPSPEAIRLPASEKTGHWDTVELAIEPTGNVLRRVNNPPMWLPGTVDDFRWCLSRFAERLAKADRELGAARTIITLDAKTIVRRVKAGKGDLDAPLKRLIHGLRRLDGVHRLLIGEDDLPEPNR